MRIAVLSDIHSNLAALEEVLRHVDDWDPDEVVVAGDVVNRGPQPAECWAQIQERVTGQGWRLLKGNHEDYVLIMRDVKLPRSGPTALFSDHAAFTYRRLKSEIDRMARLPDQVSLVGPNSEEIRIVHASMLGNRQGIYPKMSDKELQARVAPAPAVFVGGHTHRAFVRRVGATLLVNSGSVGLPFDGDARAGYAQLTVDRSGDWTADIVRLVYDREKTDRAFDDSRFLAEGGPLVRIMHVELRLARSLIFGWAQQYETAVLAGELPLAASVDHYLETVLAGV